MSTFTAVDSEGQPLTAVQHIARVVEPLLEQWVARAYATACAGVGTVGDEPAMRRGFDRMRHLHLAEPWLPAHDIARAIADEVLPLVNGPTVEQMTEVLVAHQRRASDSCLCGDLPLGSSFAEHQAVQIAALRPSARTVTTGQITTALDDWVIQTPFGEAVLREHVRAFLRALGIEVTP